MPQFALNRNGQVIAAEDAIKGEDYFCPQCNGKLIFYKGNKVPSHFQHARKAECVECTHRASAWHRRWADAFESEILIFEDAKIGLVKTDDADVALCSATVPEKDFILLNSQYTDKAKQLVWVVDIKREMLRQKLSSSPLPEALPIDDPEMLVFSWTRPPHMLDSANAAYLSRHGIRIFFETIHPEYNEPVIIESRQNDDGYAYFLGRFIYCGMFDDGLRSTFASMIREHAFDDAIRMDTLSRVVSSGISAGNQQ